MRHIISVLLENESGALSRVSGLFSARGYNIESLTVAPTHDATLSRMTIVTTGDERRIDQIEKQLNKLVDVAALQDITIDQHLEREVVLVKVDIAESEGDKAELDRVIDAFNAALIDVSEEVFIVEMSGSSDKVDELLKALNNLKLTEVVRSGAIGLTSGTESLAIKLQQVS
jgi:acetolactate synthase-1/3 small subunit